MIDRDQIEEIVQNQIEDNENIGQSSGGSGHLSFTNYKINSISEPQATAKGFKISYSYSIFVETEFTYYPDNPPKESKYDCEVTIDTDGAVLKAGKRKCTKSTIEDELMDNIDFDYEEEADF